MAVRIIDNVGRLFTRGLGFSLRNTLDTPRGAWTPRLDLTWIDTFKYSDSPAPNAPTTDRVGIASEQGTLTAWRTVLSLGWVRLVRLSGVVHAARDSEILSEGGNLAQTVSLSAGQAAFDLWEAVRTVMRMMTPFAEIGATGARFGVVVAESMTVVTVVQGSVRVRAVASNIAEMVVAAGDKLTVRPGVHARPIALANVERERGWTQGDLYFDGEIILEAAAAFNGFNELQIRPSPAIAHLTVGSHHCALSDPQRFVTRFVTSWKLGSRTAGNVIETFERGQVPELDRRVSLSDFERVAARGSTARRTSD